MCGFVKTAHLVELDNNSVSLLQEMVGSGAALGRQSITTLPFLAASTLSTGLCSNVGAQAEKNVSYKSCVSDIRCKIQAVNSQVNTVSCSSHKGTRSDVRLCISYVGAKHGL